MIPPDTLIKDRYRVVRLLGKGGGGFVYEADDLSHQRKVAIKQLIFSEPYFRRAFVREAKRLAALHHPAFPELYEWFELKDNSFLVMEYIPGDNLRTALHKHSAPFPLEKVLGWAFILLDALDYLHTFDPVAPIIHRDIKPENLKLNETNLIRRSAIILLDFGLAKGAAGNISQTSANESIVGCTPYYASPEQEFKVPNLIGNLSTAYPVRFQRFAAQSTDARSDLYSLAATLYTLLTNTTPSDVVERARRLWNNQGDPLLPIHEINPQVPPRVSDVLAYAMNLEPDERFASAAEMSAALHTAKLDTTIPIGPIVKYGTLGNCEAAVRSVAFSPGGTHLASGGNDGIVRLWNVVTGEMIIIGHCEPGETGLTYVSSVSYAPDGNSIASTSNDGAIRLWRVMPAGADRVQVFAVRAQPPRSVTFSPCGKRLASGSSDGAVHLWDVATGDSTLLGHCAGAVWSVTFTPDGAGVAAESDDGTIHIWHLESLRLEKLQTFESDIRSIAISPDGKLIAAGGGCHIRIASIGEPSMRDLAECDDTVRSLAFSPDSSMIAIGCEDALVRVCDVREGKMRTVGRCDDVVSTVTFSSDNRTIASGSWDKSVRLWDVRKRV